MKCPKDQTQMDVRNIDGAELDICPKCNGIWMDRGELSQVAGTSASEIEMNYRGKSDTPCPKCGKKMDLADLHSVIIEECEHGIFFDGGEAEKILGRDILAKATTGADIDVTRAQLKELLQRGELKIQGVRLSLKKDP